MTITAAQTQDLIIAQIGDVDPTSGRAPVGAPSPGILAQWVPVLWDQYADWDAVAPRLRGLFVRRDAIDLVVGVLRDKAVDVEEGATGIAVKEHQRIDTLLAQKASIEQQIVALKAEASRGRTGAVGVLLATAPVTPPFPGAPDANDLTYQGSPYRTRRGDWRP